MCNKKILLSITVLVSAKRKEVKRCLESLKIILDSIPSELIVVDTVGEGGCGDIAREYTDKVYPFKWCNDFAKARNEALSHASGEWFLFIDDDEWFIDASPIIDFFKSGEYRNYICAHYKLYNYINEAMTQYSEVNILRMYKLNKDTKFVGKVHEHVSGVYGTTTLIHAISGHSGYIFQTEEERKKKSKRNIELLKEELKRNPSSLQAMMQLSQELLFNEKYEELIRFGNTLINITKNEESRNSHYNYVLTAMIRAYANLYKDNELIKKFDELQKKTPMNNMTKLILHYFEVFAYCDIEQYDKCLDAAKKYYELCDFFKLHETEFLTEALTDTVKFTSEKFMIPLNERVAFAGTKVCLQKIREENYKEIHNIAAMVKKQGMFSNYAEWIRITELKIFLMEKDYVKLIDASNDFKPTSKAAKGVYDCILFEGEYNMSHFDKALEYADDFIEIADYFTYGDTEKKQPIILDYGNYYTEENISQMQKNRTLAANRQKQLQKNEFAQLEILLKNNIEMLVSSGKSDEAEQLISEAEKMGIKIHI